MRALSSLTSILASFSCNNHDSNWAINVINHFDELIHIYKHKGRIFSRQRFSSDLNISGSNAAIQKEPDIAWLLLPRP